MTDICLALRLLLSQACLVKLICVCVCVVAGLFYSGFAPLAQEDSAAYLEQWWAAVSSEGFAAIMSLDFVAFWLLSATLAWARDRAEGVNESPRWLLALFLPLLGTCAWLVSGNSPFPPRFRLKMTIFTKTGSGQTLNIGKALKKRESGAVFFSGGSVW